MLYNTKSVISSSGWHFVNEAQDHVQLEVLEAFAESAQHNLFCGDIDLEIDWLLFQSGISTAAIRFIKFHKDKNWLPCTLPNSLKAYNKGECAYGI